MFRYLHCIFVWAFTIFTFVKIYFGFCILEYGSFFIGQICILLCATMIQFKFFNRHLFSPSLYVVLIVFLFFMLLIFKRNIFDVPTNFVAIVLCCNRLVHSIPILSSSKYSKSVLVFNFDWKFSENSKKHQTHSIWIWWKW